MRQVKLILTFLILSIFVISFVSSQGCETSGWKGFGQYGENKTICVTCTTCNFINFSLTDPSGNVTINNEEMIKDGSTFCNEFGGNELEQLGTFQIDGYSQLDTPLGLCFDITLTGKENSIWAYIMSIVFVILLFIGLVWLNIKFNKKEREKLYRKIVIEYFKFDSTKNKGNMAYALFYLIAYGILRMIFVLYYLLIVLFIFIFTEMVTAFGINTFATLMPQILVISVIGFALVFVLFISMFLEIIRDLIKDIQDMFLGIQ